LGVSQQTLRNCLKQETVDAGQAEGVTSGPLTVTGITANNQAWTAIPPRR
jgi:hypothetical protein